MSKLQATPRTARSLALQPKVHFDTMIEMYNDLWSMQSMMWFVAAVLVASGGSMIWRGWLPRRRGDQRRHLVAMSGSLDVAGEASSRRYERDLFLLTVGIALQLLAVVVAWVGQAVTRYVFAQESYVGDSIVLTDCKGPLSFGLLAFGMTILMMNIIGDRSRGRRRCNRCWYDMAGSRALNDASGPAWRCPECGHAMPNAEDLYRTRRSRPCLVFSIAFLLLSYAMISLPRIIAGGWLGAVPTSALVVGIGLWPDAMISSASASRPHDVTLLGRYQTSNWQWQDWLVHRWARQVFVQPAEPTWRALRAALFLDDTLDFDIRHALKIAVAKALASGSASDRVAAAAAFRSLVTRPNWFLFSVTPRPDEQTSQLASYAPGLIEGLHDSSWEVRHLCGLYLSECGPAAKPAISRLIWLLRTNNPSCTGHVFALHSLAACSAEAREALLEFIETGPDAASAAKAGHALQSAGEFRAQTTTRLLDMLNDRREAVALAAVHALVPSHEQVTRRIVTVGLDGTMSCQAARLELINVLMYVDFNNADPELWLLVSDGLSTLLEDPSPVIRSATVAAFYYWATVKYDLSSVIGSLQRLSHDSDLAISTAAKACLKLSGVCLSGR